MKWRIKVNRLLPIIGACFFIHCGSDLSQGRIDIEFPDGLDQVIVEVPVSDFSDQQVFDAEKNSLPLQKIDRNENGVVDAIAIDLRPSDLTKQLIVQHSRAIPPETPVGVTAHYMPEDTVIIIENENSSYVIDLKTMQVGLLQARLPADLVNAYDGWEEQLIYKPDMGVGLGGPAVYDYVNIVPINSQNKETRIVCSGPLRAEVLTTVNNVPYRDGSLNFEVTFGLSKYQSALQVSIRAINNSKFSLKYAVGISKAEEASNFTQLRSNNITTGFTFGQQSKYGTPMGLCVYLNPQYPYENYSDSPLNHAFLMVPVEGIVEYGISHSVGMHAQPAVDEFGFIAHLRASAASYAQLLSVKTSPIIESE